MSTREISVVVHSITLKEIPSTGDIVLFKLETLISSLQGQDPCLKTSRVLNKYSYPHRRDGVMMKYGGKHLNQYSCPECAPGRLVPKSPL